MNPILTSSSLLFKSEGDWVLLSSEEEEIGEITTTFSLSGGHLRLRALHLGTVQGIDTTLMAVGQL